MEQFFRRIRIHHKFGFHPNRNPPKLYFPNIRYKPPLASPEVEAYIHNTKRILKTHIDLIPFKRPFYPPMTGYYRNQIISLRKTLKTKEMCVALADKNLGMVVLPISKYHQHMISTLTSIPNTFQKISRSEANKKRANLYRNIVAWCKLFFDVSSETKERDIPNMFKYITRLNPLNKSVHAKPYNLYKVHKLTDHQLNTLHMYPPTRLIVPCTNTISEAASRFLDYKLRPLFDEYVTYNLKDSKTLVQILETTPFPHSVILTSKDVSALYPSIPIKDGLEAISNFLIEHMSHDEHDLYVRLFTWIMYNNIVLYDEVYYIQTSGTAMGTPAAVLFANIFLHMIERNLVNEYTSNNTLLYFGRLIDDMFAVFSNPQAEVRFWKQYNNLHPRINITGPTGDQISFLDLVIYKGKRFKHQHFLDIRLHQKLFNRYAYLPYYSYHTEASKLGWIKAELQRSVRNNSNINDYLTFRKLFFVRLLNRRYKKNFLIKAFSQTTYANRDTYVFGPNPSTNNTPSLPPQFPAKKLIFSVIYSPTTETLNISNLIKKYWNIIIEGGIPYWVQCKPMVAYKKGATLYSMLRKHLPT